MDSYLKTSERLAFYVLNIISESLKSKIGFIKVRNFELYDYLPLLETFDY